MATLQTASRKGFRRFPLGDGDAGLVVAARPRLRPVAERTGGEELLSLARREARCRLALGRLAAVFLRRRAYHRLGFARVGDYARERLGLSGREVQGLASVATRLAELPAIEAAFGAGRLSWSQVRLLAPVASPESEVEWLGRACGATVRQLLRIVREAGGGGGSCEGPRALTEAADDEGGTIDGEETARLRIRCPARVRVLWRRTLELARRMLGAEAPVWQAAEAIAAEGMSAAPGSSIDVSEAAVARVDPIDGGGSISGTGSVANCATVGPSAALVELDLPGADPSALDPFDLDERMREVVRAMQEIDVETGARLRHLLDLGLYRSLGYSSFESFVQDGLGMSRSRAWALVRIDRKAREVPALGRAWRNGALSWSRVQAILPVLDVPIAGAKPVPDAGEAAGVESLPAPGAAADASAGALPDGAEGWIELAGQVTVRRLADEVDRALDAADLQMCARSGEETADREVTFRGPVSVVGLFRDAVAAFTVRDRPRDGAGGGTSGGGEFAEVVEPADLAEPTEPAWKGLERLLEHACREWTAQPRHRDPVFERDGWRCAVPACTSRRNLHDHHRRFRSRGGGNERSNRVATCAWHHLRGIHGGLVRVEGLAPDGLRWGLGLRPGRVPLLVFDGDWYAGGH